MRFLEKGRSGRLWKKAAAYVLLLGMVFSSVDVSALAKEAGAAVGRLVDAASGPGGALTPDITPDREEEFGAYALSNAVLRKRPGKTAVMKVHAWSKTGELSYTWYHAAGYELEEETSDTLTMKGLTDREFDSDFGTYSCRVTDGVHEKWVYFQVEKESSMVVRQEMPYVDRYNGEPLNLAVKAKDYGEPEAEIAYQWYRKGKLLEGETDPTLMRPHKGTQGKQVKYSCTVTNGRSVETVNFEVYTHGNHLSLTNGIGEGYYRKTGEAFTIDISEKISSGNPYATLSYRWQIEYSDGERIDLEDAGKPQQTFQMGDREFRIYCTVSDESGNEKMWYCYNYPTSHSFWVSPNGNSFRPGEKEIELSVTAYPAMDGVDIEECSYQWHKRGADGEEDLEIEGATDRTLTIFNASLQEGGQYYYCLVTLGEETQRQDVYVGRYQYSLNRAAHVVSPGMEVTYRVVGDEWDRSLEARPAKYQWYQSVNGSETALEGETAISFTHTVTEEELGEAQASYFCKVTVGDVEYRSEASRYIDRMDVSAAYDSWEYLYFNRAYEESIVLDTCVTADAAENLTVKWEQLDGWVYDADGIGHEEWLELDEKGLSYEVNLDAVDGNHEQYRVTISDGQSLVTKQFVISQEHCIYVGDAYHEVKAHPGESAELRCEAETSLPEGMQYQWQKQKHDADWGWEYQDIDGATGQTYQIASVGDETYGSYRCIATDGNESREYHVTLRQYQFQHEYEGDLGTLYPGQRNVSIPAGVTYEDERWELTYEWQKEQAVQHYDEAGDYYWTDWEWKTLDATGDTLTLEQLTEDSFGNYRCIVRAGESDTMQYYGIYSSVFYVNGMQTGELPVYAEIGDQIPALVELGIEKEELERQQVSYQWKRIAQNGNGEMEEIPGAAESRYVAHIEGDADFGVYACTININGVETQARMDLRNSDEPVLNANAECSYYSYRSLLLKPGQSETLKAVAYCQGDDLTYQWHRGYWYEAYEAIEGADQEEFQLTPTKEEDFTKYFCEVSCPRHRLTRTVEYDIWADVPIEPEEPTTPPEPENPATPPEPDKPERPVTPPEPENPVTPPEPEQPAPVIAVTGVSLSKSALTLPVGESAALQAAVAPGNATDKTVSWSSSDASVAEVQGGVVRAKKAGNAVITVTTADGAKTASCAVRVTVPAKNISMLKEKCMAKGDSFQIKAALKPKNTTDAVSWSTTNAAVATVEGGEVKAVGAGTAKILAKTESGKKAICKIIVVKKAIKALKVTLKGQETMNCGETMQLTAALKPQKCTEALEWSSSSKKLATVDSNGIVTAKKPGIVKITVKTEGSKKTDSFKIIIKQPVKSMTFSSSAVKLKLGKSMKLDLKVIPSNYTDRLRWSSSNKRIASVDKDGKVQGLKKGKVTITVKAGKKKKASCTLIVGK